MGRVGAIALPFVWLGGAAVMGLLELAVGDFSLLMLAGGALATSGAAALGASLWLQCVVFMVASTLLLMGVRPALRRRLTQSTSQVHNAIEAYPGRTCEVVELVGGSAGMVRIDGELWSARSAFPGETFAPGDAVIITEIDGATVRVTTPPELLR